MARGAGWALLACLASCRAPHALPSVPTRARAQRGDRLVGTSWSATGSAAAGDLHEQSLLSTATLEDFEIVESIGAGSNGQIFKVVCTIPQVPCFDLVATRKGKGGEVGKSTTLGKIPRCFYPTFPCRSLFEPFIPPVLRHLPLAARRLRAASMR